MQTQEKGQCKQLLLVFVRGTMAPPLAFSCGGFESPWFLSSLNGWGLWRELVTGGRLAFLQSTVHKCCEDLQFGKEPCSPQ